LIKSWKTGKLREAEECISILYFTNKIEKVIRPKQDIQGYNNKKKILRRQRVRRSFVGGKTLIRFRVHHGFSLRKKL